MTRRLALILVALASCGKGDPSSTSSSTSSGSSTSSTSPSASPATASGLAPAAPAATATGDAKTWTPHALPRPAHLEPAAAFGDALDLDGDTLVVGAPGALFGDAPGAVYVYQRHGAAWDAPVALAPPASRQHFGNAVAVSGDTIAAATGHGTVLVYGRSAGKWGAPMEIALPLQDPSHPYFSVALDLERDTLVVGIQDWEVSHSLGQGAALVYQRAGGAWTKTAELLAPDVESRRTHDDPAAFGWKVAVRGDLLAVTSRQAKCASGIDMCGAAYVFERAGTAWKPVLTLPSGDLARWSQLGWSLAIDDRAVAIGIGGERRAWIVEQTPNGWRDAGTLGERATGNAPGTDFAAAVALRGGLAARGVVVNAPVGRPPTIQGTNEIDVAAMGKARGASPGSVLVYMRQRADWTLAATLASPNAVGGDEFGATLVLGDDVLYVGAPSNGAGEVIAFTHAP